MSNLVWVPLLESARLPNVCGVYIIRNKLNGKEYVGKSNNMRRRMKEHKHPSTALPSGKKPHGTYLARALQKHGADVFEVCVYFTGREIEALALEVQLISERKTFILGYNRTLGGEGVKGRVWSPEQLKEASLRNKGKTISEETRQKIRESVTAVCDDRRGIPRSESTRRKYQYLGTVNLMALEAR